MNRYRKINEDTLMGLIKDSLLLGYLKAAGVDNWCGYEENFNECLKEDADSLGINYETEDDDYVDINFYDIAEVIMEDYPIVE